MHKHDNGDVTLSQKEWKGLGAAYESLYSIANDGPSNLGDYYHNVPHLYLSICQWNCWLKGEEFIREDWVEGKFWDNLENDEGDEGDTAKTEDDDD